MSQQQVKVQQQPTRRPPRQADDRRSPSGRIRWAN